MDAADPETARNIDMDVAVDVIASLKTDPEIQKLTLAFENNTQNKTKLDGFLTQARRLIATHVQFVVGSSVVSCFCVCAQGASSSDVYRICTTYIQS